jgi:hypothetical protein
LVEGTNIHITKSGNEVIISADNGATGAVTQSELATATANLQTEIETVTGDVIDTVTSMIPAAQVQSDWTESDTSDPSYIQNKPSEKTLVEGENVHITASGDYIVISADGGQVTGDYVERDELEAVTAEVLDQATGAIPAQVQSDWTQTVTGDPSYIKHKPDTLPLVAGDNVTINEVNGEIVISAQGGVTGDFVETSELEAATADIQSEIESVTAQIPTGCVTEEELAAATATIPEDKVIKVDYGDNGNTFTTDEANAWRTSGKFVYLYVPEGASLPNNPPRGLTDYGPLILPLMHVGNWEARAYFIGIVDLEAFGQGKYIVELSYDKYGTNTGNTYWVGKYTKVVTESDLTNNYIPYAATGVYLPNSNFEIGSDGTAYKIDSPESYTLMTDWEGTYELQILADVVAGVYEFRVAGNTATYIKASGWGFPAELRNGVPLVNGRARVTFPNIGVDYQYTTIASYDSDNNQCYDTMQAYLVTPEVKSEYALKSDIQSVTGFVTEEELAAVTASIPSTDNLATKAEVAAATGDIQADVETVSSMITPELPVVGGTGIGITETSTEITIAVTGDYVTSAELATATAAVEADIPVVTGFATKSELTTGLNGKQSTLTGITDVQVVQSLPASPVATVLYLIPEA